MIGPAKLANETCAASIVRMNSTTTTSFGSKQVQPIQAKPYYFCLNSRRESKFGIVECSVIIASEAKTIHLL
jgi:hypothetical protein